MCTAATYQTRDFYFGRTLDYEFSYPSEVTITPRRFPLSFRHTGSMNEHYAIIGMAYVANGYPLYYDAINEKGLGMAGLNFVGNAAYAAPCEGKENIAQFEFIPWILAHCADLREARAALTGMNLTGTPFSETLPPASLHWLIADASGAIVVESMADGLHIYDDPVGILVFVGVADDPDRLCFRIEADSLLMRNDFPHIAQLDPGFRQQTVINF